MAANKRNRRPSYNPKVIIARWVIALFVFTAFGYVIIGSLASKVSQVKRSFIMKSPKNSMVEKLNEVYDLRKQTGAFDDFKIHNKRNPIKFRGILSEGAYINISADWLNADTFRMDIGSNTNGFKGFWEYTFKSDSLTIEENIETDDVGYRAYLFFREAFINMDEEMEILNGED